MGISVTSEIKPLKKVLLHRPGREIENLTPEYLERLLFDDIPYLKVAQEEHDEFADVLRKNDVEVVYLHELMAEAIKDDEVKDEFIKQFIKESKVKSVQARENIYDYLKSFTCNEELVRKTMEGINKSELPKVKNCTLTDYIDDSYPFITDPMPNLYFTRDPFASIGSSISLNRMYSITRNRETIYADYIFRHHRDYKDTSRIYDRTLEHHIEGGDILNLNEKVLAIGISQRTTSEAIEKLASNIFFQEDSEIETILAFKIPKTRAYMHLDTVFTQVDYDKFTIHPQIEGPLEIFELTRGKEKQLNIKKESMTLEEVLSKYLECDVKLIRCGGGDYVISQREQWNDGSNTLCIRPGEVIVYARNYVTNEILLKNNIKIHVIPSSELSRGRGGPRCMSMPLIRER
ncbi:arginine deiminase [Clostridium ihumii]|uniref:arginine deiminase n=1 Tax=Clostridium ihumii TaxID=1470356 RepID=UPI00054EF5EC|nr:arginine deiminase [Clostridium ihumii]